MTTTMPGHIFRKYREMIGTDTEVADQMETTRSTIHRWENDKREIPGPARVLIRILAEKALAEQEAEAAEVRRLEKAKGRANARA